MPAVCRLINFCCGLSIVFAPLSPFEVIFTAHTTIPTAVTVERPDLKGIDPELLSYITKEEFGNLPVDQKTKDAISNVMKYRYGIKFHFLF